MLIYSKNNLAKFHSDQILVFTSRSETDLYR